MCDPVGVEFSIIKSLFNKYMTPMGSHIGAKISTSRLIDPNGVAHWCKKPIPFDTSTLSGSNIGTKIAT
jgi:hypothetical protein